MRKRSSLSARFRYGNGEGKSFPRLWGETPRYYSHPVTKCDRKPRRLAAFARKEQFPDMAVNDTCRFDAPAAALSALTSNMEHSLPDLLRNWRVNPGWR